MEEQDIAVNTQAETTASPDSASAQNEVSQAQTTPAGESAAPEQRVSPSVPYERFKEVNDRVRQLEEIVGAHLPRQAPAPQPVAPADGIPFDNETLSGITTVYQRLREKERAEEFARSHQDELQDPLLRGAVLIELQEANARGEYLPQETALANAKKALDLRLAPQVDAASKESFEEGKDLARRKERAGAVGGTGGASPKTDPDSLSAEEYAAYYNLERTF